MMFVDHRLHYLREMRTVLGTVVYPIKSLAALPVEIYRWGNESFSTRNKLLNDNVKLKKKQAHLEIQLQKLAALERENARLRELLMSSKPFRKERLLIAELMSIDMYPYHQRIVLNKGSRDGVYEGQPLLGAKGIIGQIDKTSVFNSIAILISDPNHTLLGTITRSGERSLIFGTGSPERLELRHLTNSADVKVGDLVTTSGLDNRYPPNYPIAKITSIQKTSGETFMKVAAKPLVDLNVIREVLLIWPNNQNTDHTMNDDH